MDQEGCPLSQAVPITASGRVLSLEPPTQTTPNPSSQTICPLWHCSQLQSPVCPWHCSQLQSPVCPWHCSGMAPHPGAPVQHPWCTHLAECPCGIQSLGHGAHLCPSSSSRTPIPHHSCWQGKSLLSHKQQMGCPALPTHQHHGLGRLQAGGRFRHAGTHSTACDPSTILFCVCWRFL